MSDPGTSLIWLSVDVLFLISYMAPEDVPYTVQELSRDDWTVYPPHKELSSLYIQKVYPLTHVKDIFECKELCKKLNSIKIIISGSFLYII